MANLLSRGRNNITCKPAEIFVFNRLTNSESLPDARLKLLVAYRDACRRIPYIMRGNGLYELVHPVKARMNLGNYLRRTQYVRNKSTMDLLTSELYEWLYDSVWMYNHYHNFAAILLDPSCDHTAYSYLDETKYAGNSNFLKDFYQGSGKPNF